MRWLIVAVALVLTACSSTAKPTAVPTSTPAPVVTDSRNTAAEAALMPRLTGTWGAHVKGVTIEGRVVTVATDLSSNNAADAQGICGVASAFVYSTDGAQYGLNDNSDAVVIDDANGTYIVMRVNISDNCKP